MAITLDPVTQSAYLVGTTVAARASAVVAAFSGTVTVKVFDGTDTERASGTFNGTWASQVAGTITVGEVISLTVTNGGTPDDSWYVKFQDADSWIRGTFGLAGSGKDFRWSGATFQTGQVGDLGTVTFTAVDPNPLSAPVNSVLPSISGTAQVGFVLSATSGTWSGVPAPTYAYQWLRNGSNISGATSGGYTLVSADEGALIAVRVTATNTAGSASATSAAVGPVAAAEVPLDASAVPSPINLDLGGTFDFTPYITGGTAPYTVSVASGSSLPSGVSLSNNVLTATGSATVALSGDIVFNVDDSASVGSLPVFGITSAVGGSDLPFTFGHVFAQGDVPSGFYVTMSGVSAYQVDARNTWSDDGSLAFAVISAIAPLTANVRSNFQLGVTTTAPVVANVASVVVGDITGTTSVTHSVAGTVTLADAINGVNLSNFSGISGARPASAGKIRSIPGSVMTEEHFYSPFPSHGHLGVFWYVRKYSNGRICIEASVEQGWARVDGPAELGGSVTITIGGAVVFSGEVAHRHHARFSKAAWIGGDPQIVPHHDGAYMRASRLVPNSDVAAPSAENLNALVQSVLPMARGPFSQAAAGAGYHGHIGLIPVWDAMYVTSDGDARAYNAVLAAEQASNCCGYYGAGFVWRDEQTLRPINIPSYYNESTSNAYGGSLIERGTNTSGNVWSTDPAHGWAAGYIAYLVTGRWFSLETIQFNAGADFVCWGVSDANQTRNDGTRWMFAEDRGAAWSMRAKAFALAMTPETISDQSALKAGYKTHIQHGWDRWHAEEISSNTLGIRKRLQPGNATSYGPDPYVRAGTFQQHFIAQSFAFTYQVAGHLLDSSSRAKWLDIARFHLKLPVGLAGTSTDFCYRHFTAVYGLIVGPNYSVDPYSFYSNFGQIYDAHVAEGLFTDDAVCASGGALIDAVIGGTTYSATGGWLFTTNGVPALALAVDFELDGAQDAWNRLSSASNWQTLYGNFSTYPQWGVVPRSA